MLLFPWWISVSCLERGSPKFSVHVVIPPPPPLHPSPLGRRLSRWQKRGGLRGRETPRRIRSLRSKRAEFTYSPLYESVGLISIRLSCPPLPVIRCMASPSCVWASVNGTCPQPDALGPVTLPPGGTVLLSESRFPRETPRLTELTGRLPSFTQGPAASPQPRAGGGFAGRSGLPSHRANGWSRLGEAAGCWTEVPTFKGMWHDAAQSVQTFKGKVWTPTAAASKKNNEANAKRTAWKLMFVFGVG